MLEPNSLIFKQYEKPVTREELAQDHRMERVTSAVIASGADFKAADVYEAFAKMADFSAAARFEMSKVTYDSKWELRYS